MSKEHIITFVIVVVAVLAASFIAKKFLGMSSYEEFYEENFDDADYREVSDYHRAA